MPWRRGRWRPARGRGRPALWDKFRHDPDYMRLYIMLQFAHGKPIKPYQLAKKAVRFYPPLVGDEFGHIKRLGTKFKKLFNLIDEVLTEERRPNTEQDRRLAALTFVEYLMEPRDHQGRTRAEQEIARKRQEAGLKIAVKRIEAAFGAGAILKREEGSANRDRDRASAPMLLPRKPR